MWPWLSSFVGVIVSALVQFFSSKGGAMLAGLGVSIAVAKGLDNIAQFIIGDLQTVTSSLGSGGGSGGGGNLGMIMLQYTAYCGLPDAINIVISGFITATGITEGRAFFRRMV